jgi:hypothetical protein
MRSKATTVAAYLQELPPDRRATIRTVRDVILKNLPDGLVETIGWGMISYVIPAEKSPKTYNGQPMMLAALASEKNYCSLHLMSLYMSAEREGWLRDRFARAGKTLKMGKACIRFATPDDLELDAIGEIVKRSTPERFLEAFAAARADAAARKRSTRRA